MSVLTGIRWGLLLLLMPACGPDVADRLQFIDQEGLHFASGQSLALQPDTGQLILFILAYSPSDPPARLAAHGDRVRELLLHAGIADFYTLDRPSAMDVIQPLRLATSGTLHPFAYEVARDTLDHILSMEGPAPQLMVASYTILEDLLPSRLPTDRKEWADQRTNELAVVVLRPGVGLQIMKFPF